MWVLVVLVVVPVVLLLLLLLLLLVLFALLAMLRVQREAAELGLRPSLPSQCLQKIAHHYLTFPVFHIGKKKNGSKTKRARD